MRLATAGLAEKFKNMPMRIKMVMSVSKTLSTVHHQLAICERLLRENVNTRSSDYNKLHKPKAAKMKPIIQKRMVTVVSGQPNCSKWWCIGAILKKRLPPVFLK